MVEFSVGKSYTSRKGVKFTVIDIKDDLVTIQHINFKRKARIITWCGVNAIIFDFGKDMILAEPIKPIDDETVEYGYNHKEVLINKNGESYVNLFKRHQEA